MQFTTSYSPATTMFVAMSREHLRQFYSDFIKNIPYCVEELLHMVRTTPEHEGWMGDCSPHSLDMLGEWFAKKVRKRDLLREELNIRASQTRGDIEVESWELTPETKSLAVYVGMYYGQVVLKEHPELRWEQQLSSKKLADFGQPVLKGLGTPPLNPVRVANSVASGVVQGISNGKRLRDAYDYWSSLIRPVAS